MYVRVSLLMDVSQEMFNYIYLAPYAYFFDADFACDFGRSSASGLDDCGIRQPTPNKPWGIACGYNTYFGNDANSDDQLGKWN